MTKDEYWKTKDGKKIKISETETNHIQNALAMLRRKGFIAKSTVDFYMSTPGPSGDAAQDCFMHEFDIIMNSPVFQNMDLLEIELSKRDVITEEDLVL